MNALQKTLAIVALLILTSQTIRHIYVLWFEPRTSVLDKYDRPLSNEIAGAASLDELVRRFDAVHKDVEAAKQELAKTGKELNYRQEQESEPYTSERELREAIKGWEEKSKEIHALRFYWFVGLGFVLLGLMAYAKLNRWFGLTLLIAGFAEFIYWTSLTFLGANTREFDRLLGYKLVLSAVSLVLLAGVIWFLRIFADPKEQSAR